MYLKYYLEQLGYLNMPEFFPKYLSAPSLVRLKKVSYFCGMDYASKDIYQFREYISRYDHSLSVFKNVYNFTNDPKASLAGFCHDIATPCFSHVIDYMNKDYERQESTEEYTEKIILSDEYLLDCFKKDGINIDDIIDFKKYPIVDNERPRLCADRIDGIILPGIAWTKNIELEDIKRIVNNLCIINNEDGKPEIGFTDYDVAKKVVEVSESIDLLCHSSEDNYMMELLANITRLMISKGYIKYDDLYVLNEEELFYLISNTKDPEISKLYLEFILIKKEDIPKTKLSNVKIRDINPLVKSKRFNAY